MFLSLFLYFLFLSFDLYVFTGINAIVLITAVQYYGLISSKTVSPHILSVQNFPSYSCLLIFP